MNSLDNFFIKNLSGTMCYKDEELFEFSIVDRELVHFKQLSPYHFIWTFLNEEATYFNINLFLRDRIKPEHSMMIKEFLEAYRLDYYDAEEIVKRNNCNNRIDFYWVKYQNFGPQTYEEMRSLTEPPWTVGVLEDYYKPSYENVVGEFKWKEFYKENVWPKNLK